MVSMVYVYFVSNPYLDILIVFGGTAGCFAAWTLLVWVLSGFGEASRLDHHDEGI